MLLAFADGCVQNIFEPILPVSLSNEWGYDSSQIGLVFIAEVIPTFIATALAGFLTDKDGPKIVCLTTLVICAISMFFIGIPNHSTAGGIVPLIVLLTIQDFASFSFASFSFASFSFLNPFYRKWLLFKNKILLVANRPGYVDMLCLILVKLNTVILTVYLCSKSDLILLFSFCIGSCCWPTC
jgi:MFS family permease